MEVVYIPDLYGNCIYTRDLSGIEAMVDASQFVNGTYFLSIRFVDDMVQTVCLEVVK
ncbi:MAG: hypothetical protein HRT58_10495 [Crocinitomicaceae bacterium]|nr:hypothetical protein [Flavobacteriales bacterium]NQZ36084.1 hypothetical protein [Crocinitomicaceae bacterium]